MILDENLVYKPKKLGSFSLVTIFPAAFSCKNPTPPEPQFPRRSSGGFRGSKKAAGKKVTRVFLLGGKAAVQSAQPRKGRI